MNEHRKILIVEDQPNDFELASREIKQIIKSCEFKRVENRKDFLDALSEYKPDIIVTDYSMPEFDGLSVISLTKQFAPLIPVIVFTGSIDEETAAETVKAGAVDYVIKENLKRIKQAIRHALDKKLMWQERIAAQEKLRISEERYRLISNVTSDYMFSTIVMPDDSLELNWVAGAFERITGYTLEEYKAKGGWRYALYPEDISVDKNDFKGLMANQKVVSEIRTIKKNGEILWVKIYAHPVWDEKKNCLTGIYGAVQDIHERKLAEEKTIRLNFELENLVKERTRELEQTNAELKIEVAERTKAEEYIKQQLAEREILLKEIHHRVKNNMQVIISILNLQASFIKNKKIVSLLQDSQSRIKTMALIHEKLYQTKSFSNIDFTEYISNLFKYLFTSYKSPNQNVEYKINTEPIPLDIDTIISLGLITNELVSNSFKYAFAEREHCVIEISFKKSDKKNLIFSITDNGKGLPEGFDYKNTESLGLQLVCLLTDQIQGKLNVESSDNGTVFNIIFPAKKS